jgi:hypothetical protein
MVFQELAPSGRSSKRLVELRLNLIELPMREKFQLSFLIEAKQLDGCLGVLLAELLCDLVGSDFSYYGPQTLLAFPPPRWSTRQDWTPCDQQANQPWHAP